jgi:hypothetical protein
MAADAMSTRVTVTVICDKCHAELATSRNTSTGARGDAKRKGWRISYQGDGYRQDKASNNPTRRDECLACQPPKAAPTDGLFA